MCSFIWCAEGSIGLAVVGGVAVEAGDLVDTLDIDKCEARRSSKDVEGEFVSLLSTIVLSEYLPQRFGEGRVAG